MPAPEFILSYRWRCGLCLSVEKICQLEFVPPDGPGAFVVFAICGAVGHWLRRIDPPFADDGGIAGLGGIGEGFEHGLSGRVEDEAAGVRNRDHVPRW